MTRTRNEHDTAEAWLRELTNALRPDFEKIGYKLPEQIRFDFGFTSHGKRKGPAGEFFDGNAASDGWSKAIIRCDKAEIEAVTGSLAHQLVHAAVGRKAGHGKAFRDCALRFGLDGKMREAMPGPKLRERLHALAEQLGPFPHGAMDFAQSGHEDDVRPVDRKPKQRTRMLKCECLNKGCGYPCRTTAKWLRIAVPECPVCKQPMWHEELPADDDAVEEPAGEDDSPEVEE
jgi:hypothetical protein